MYLYMLTAIQGLLSMMKYAYILATKTYTWRRTEKINIASHRRKELKYHASLKQVDVNSMLSLQKN